MKREESVQSAREWIENGGKCYQMGVGEITKEKALDLINKGSYIFGMSFYELSWRTDRETGEDYLYFDEHNENYFW